MNGTVLHLMQCTNLGGMEQITYRLMDQLKARGLSFRIASPRPFGPGIGRVRSIDRSARDFPYRGRFGWRDFPALRRHVHEVATECDTIWVTGTSVAALAAIKGLPHRKILSHHYHHFEGKLSWLRWRAFYEGLCRDLDLITYPTQMTRDEAVSIAPWLARKAKILPNGIDVHYIDPTTAHTRRIDARRQLGIPEDAFVVGNAGWLIQRKRFDVFLQVAKKVHEALPQSQFVICGSGDEETALRKLTAELDLCSAVRFTGWTSDLVLHYRSWDALLFNTDFDTLPLTTMEAAAEGCVVVVSQVYGGLGEFIEHGKTGYLFPKHDVDALASALLEVHADPAHAEQLREQAAAKLRSKFSLEAMTDFFADCLTTDGR